MAVDILIYGFSGYNRVLAELLNISQKYNIGVFDNEKPESLPDYVEYFGLYNINTHPDKKIILAIGRPLPVTSKEGLLKTFKSFLN